MPPLRAAPHVPRARPWACARGRPPSARFAVAGARRHRGDVGATSGRVRAERERGVRGTARLPTAVQRRQARLAPFGCPGLRTGGNPVAAIALRRRTSTYAPPSADTRLRQPVALVAHQKRPVSFRETASRCTSPSLTQATPYSSKGLDTAAMLVDVMARPAARAFGCVVLQRDRAAWKEQVSFDFCGQISADEKRASVRRALNNVVALVCLMERAFRGADESSAVRRPQRRATRRT